jgi:hypothetical protein
MRVSVRDLFQIGVSRALDLRSRAAGVVRRWWPDWRERGFRLLGSPGEGIMRGLMKRVPQYYALGWGGDVEFRDFESMDEIRRAGEILDEVIEGADTCFGVLGIPRPADAELTKPDAFARGVEEIELGNLIATGFVNFVRHGEFDIAPLVRDDISTLFEVLLEKAPRGGRRLSREPVDLFLGWLRERSGRDGAGWQALRRFVRKAIAKVEEEIKSVRTPADLDPRYIRSLILEASDKEDRSSG